MKILICGGRHFNDYDGLVEIMSNYDNVESIIHGGATGADSLGQMWAVDYDVPVKTYPANWKDLSHPDAVIKSGGYGKYDALAGHRRNQQMLDEGKPDLVVALPGGRGTQDMVNRSRAVGVPVHKVEVKRVPVEYVIQVIGGEKLNGV